VRRSLQIAAGLALGWLAVHAVAHASVPGPAPALPPSEPIGAAWDADAALPAHADPVASYTLQASLDTAKHVVTGRGTIRWRNASRVAQRELWVHLYLNGYKNDRTVFLRFPAADTFRGAGVPSEWGYIVVKRLAIAGGADLWAGADKTSPGDPEDETDIRVPLPQPVEPGATLELEVEFESHLPSLLFRTGHSGSFEMVGQWFPKLARLEPDGAWAHWPFHHLSEFSADFGAYDVTIDTPEAFTVGATGALAGEAHTNGRVQRRFVQEDVHDFAFTAWDGFSELTALTADGVAVRVLYPRGYDRAAVVELDAARFGLAHLGRAYGRYPYKTLTLVHPPEGAEEGGGMEYPTLITTGGSWYMPWTGARVIDIVTIHELGHQWFYGLVATDEHAWPFLDEGINSYAEVDAMEALDPGASAFRGLGLSLGIAALNRVPASDAERNARVAQPAPDFATGGDYGALVYARTATILTTLANVYGAGEVQRAVGRYARRYRFQHPGPAELVQSVREVVGDDAAEQLRVALFEGGTVDYTVAELTSAPDAPTRGIVGDPAAPGAPTPVADPGAWRGSALVRRRGALRFPVDVDLIGADGAVQRVRWSAEEPSARLPWHGRSKLAAAVIDPEHRVLLDDDLGNNARPGGPSLSTPLVDRLAFAASVLLGGVTP
jgi:hypothetical protein